jgi:hypothetical protein
MAILVGYTGVICVIAWVGRGTGIKI